MSELVTTGPVCDVCKLRLAAAVIDGMNLCGPCGLHRERRRRGVGA